jgi:hypothetical protein
MPRSSLPIWISPSRAAKLTGFSVMTIRRFMASGALSTRQSSAHDKVLLADLQKVAKREFTVEDWARD